MVRRQLKKEQMHESEEKYHLLFEHLNEAAFIADVETGLIIGTNIRGTELLKRSRDEINGMYLIELHPPGKVEQYRHMYSIHNKQEYAVDSDCEVIRTDGTIIPVKISTSTINIGERHLMLGLFHDITEHKRAEDALKESEEFRSRLLSNAPSPILVLNKDTSVRYINKAFEDLTGFTSADIIGEKAPYPWWILPPEEGLKALKRAMQEVKYRSEMQFQDKNGKRFWIEINSAPIKQDGKLRHFLSSWVDITERKRLKNSMQFYISGSIKAQEEERKRVSRELHDDTIQSLATLSQNIETTISKEKDRLPEETLQQLESILYKARSIMQGVRRFSHELRPDIIDRLGLVPSLEQLTSELNKENGIKARIEVIGSEKRLPPEIELVLFRIAQEALRNIWKHSQSIEAVIKLEFTQEEAEMNVSDDGRGFRVAKYLSDFAGKGKLGLCGMQERARLIGGDFSVKSQLGKGTTIKVKVKV